MDLACARLFLPLTLLALFCLRLGWYRSYRAQARANLVYLAQRQPRPAVRAVAATFLWLATLALALEAALYIGIQAPEALKSLHALALSVAWIALAAAGCVWIFGGKTTASWPPDADRRLAAAAKRLGVATEEAAMGAIDAGLAQLEADGG